jgi:lipoprotein-anchoring transpeptidase ErfK/SrfK
MPGHPIRRRTLLGLGAVGLAELAVVACSKSSSTAGRPSVGVGSSSSPAAAVRTTPATSPSSTASAPAASSSARASGAPVHVRLLEGDGGSYGVGMPIIAYLSAMITDAKAFNQATTVSVNGAPVAGAWYFEKSAIYPGYPLEAHYRMQEYWPAHAAIKLDLPISGLSAGTGFVFDDDLTLSMSTGARNITTVDGATERLVTTSDGKPVFDFPVSLGKASTPTFTGTKIVMERDRIERMIGTTPGDAYNLLVPWSVRLTNSGEFIHAASWNGGNIGQRSTSNGCTNLNVAAAQQYFNFAKIGDVATYTNTGGTTMPVWDGYGDWNMSWATWQQGGLLPAT